VCNGYVAFGVCFLVFWLKSSKSIFYQNAVSVSCDAKLHWISRILGFKGKFLLKCIFPLNITFKAFAYLFIRLSIFLREYSVKLECVQPMKLQSMLCHHLCVALYVELHIVLRPLVAELVNQDFAIRCFSLYIIKAFITLYSAVLCCICKYAFGFYVIARYMFLNVIKPLSVCFMFFENLRLCLISCVRVVFIIFQSLLPSIGVLHTITIALRSRILILKDNKQHSNFIKSLLYYSFALSFVLKSAICAIVLWICKEFAVFARFLAYGFGFLEYSRCIFSYGYEA
jgi:hypothetical protein